MKKLLFILLLFALTIPILAYEEHTEYDEYEEQPLYQAASVLAMCAETGIVLYETEGYTRRYPASITKVMTALLVLENVHDLEERLILSPHAVDIPDYASRMGLYEGEDISVLEALYGIMLPSGNEVARALAEHVSGSVPAFIEHMNIRAIELGAYCTHFVNACGLPGDGQHVTAHDVAVIMRAAIQHPVFVDIISTPFFELPPTNMHEYTRRLVNTNRMIRYETEEFNPYVIGGKTGFTRAAQHTLVTYAQRGNHKLILAVLYTPRLINFADTAALMNLVFDMMDAAELEAQIAAQQLAAELEAERIAQAQALEYELARLEAEREAIRLRAEQEAQPNSHMRDVSLREAAIAAGSILAVVITGLLILLIYYKIKNK